MLTTVAKFLFGCAHRHTSFPITCRVGDGANGRKQMQPMETYVVCLDCGQRFPYDWSAMRIIKQPTGAAESTLGRSSSRTGAAFPAANRFLQRLVHHT